MVLKEFAKAGDSKATKGKRNPIGKTHGVNSEVYGEFKAQPDMVSGYDDIGSPARFFYTAKPSSAEKNLLYGEFEEKQTTGGGGMNNEIVGGKFGSIKAAGKNFHPTVKAQSLMQYLIKLITPPKGIVLDMFAGSGSTLLAAKNLGHPYIGIEIDSEYVAIAEGRLKQGVLNF